MIELWQIQNWYHFLLGIIVGGGIISLYYDYKNKKNSSHKTEYQSSEGVSK